MGHPRSTCDKYVKSVYGLRDNLCLQGRKVKRPVTPWINTLSPTLPPAADKPKQKYKNEAPVHLILDDMLNPFKHLKHLITDKYVNVQQSLNRFLIENGLI